MINDGQNKQIKILCRMSNRVHSALIVYRPMLEKSRKRFLDEINLVSSDVVSARVLMTSMLRSKIVSVECRCDFGHFLHRLFYSPGACEWLRLFDAVIGAGQTKTERFRNNEFKKVISLQLTHPWLLRTPCNECRKWIYNPTTGTFWQNMQQPRQPEDVLLCETLSGCPKGHYSKPVCWTRESWLAYSFDRSCRQSGVWPDDEIVLNHKRIIDDAIQEQRLAGK